MSRRLLVAPLVVCAFLLAYPTSSWAAPLPEASVLLENLQSRFPAPEREQQQVLRSLRLEVGAESAPVFDAPQARLWMQSPPASTKEGQLKRMRDELELSRRFAKSKDVETLRVALSLALDAAHTARDGGDMPLTTAIGAGFLLPVLLSAPASGTESRFQILSALEEPFSIFELLPAENQSLPLPDNQAALDFERLQIALAPTPREANWPRVRLARRLFRGNGTFADRAVAFNDKGAREAFDALRALVPGEGTLLFRRSMPALATRIGEILSPAELLDSAQTARKHPGTQFPFGAEAMETLDSLRAICHHSPQDRAALIEETARRCDFAPGEREQLDTEADKSFDTVIQRYLRRLIEGAGVNAVPRSRASLYRGYYVALRGIDAALQQPEPKIIQQKIGDLENVAYWPGDDPVLGDTLRWRYGDYRANAEFDAFHAQIAETFLVDAVPFMDIDMTHSDNVESLTRAFPDTFLKVYPNWVPVRELRSKAESLAQKDVQEGKNAILISYEPSVNARMCSLDRASCDLLARTATTENRHDGTIYAMLRALSAQDRIEDALSILDLQWAREHFTLDQHSDNAYWTKRINAQLQTRFASPTLLRPLP